MRYVFGDYEVDTQRDELRHGGILCPLESQVFQCSSTSCSTVTGWSQRQNSSSISGLSSI